MSHTPAPWKANRCNPGGGILVEEVNADQNTIIATVWETRRETQVGDARLIAAAPDLLEALKQLREWCYGNVAYFGDPIKGPSSNALDRVVDAALAKAER